MGLRSAEGEQGPRCLHSPSPSLRTGNNLGFSSLPPVFLIALTPSMRKVPPPRSHPHKLNKPAGFGSPPAATPPLLPLLSCLAPCARSTLLPSTSFTYPLTFLFLRCFLILSKFGPLLRCVISCQNESKNTTASPPRKAIGEPAEKRQSSRSTAGTSRCSESWC